MADDRNHDNRGRYDRDDDRGFGRNASRGYGQDDGRSYGSGRDFDSDRGGRDFGRGDRNFRGGGTGYGGTGYGGNDYGQRGGYGSDRGSLGSDRDRGFAGGGFRETYGSDAGGRDYYGGRQGNRWGGEDDRGYRGGSSNQYASGRSSNDERSSNDPRHGNYGRQPEGYSYQDRGFLDRAGDEVRSWFGDEEAERRRELDERHDERSRANEARYGANRHDSDYHSWRQTQIDALDRDYHEYRQENASKFENEFGTWRTERQGQRSALSKVNEHMEVVGSDGQKVGTVDKVRGDRIILTKNDPQAGGHHHSIPSRWIESVDTSVRIRKTAEEARNHWRDEERNDTSYGERNPDRWSGNTPTAGGETTTGASYTSGTGPIGGATTSGGSTSRSTSGIDQG